MKITEKQALILFQIAYDSIQKNVVGMFTIPIKQRGDLINQILNQQDNDKFLETIK